MKTKWFVHHFVKRAKAPWYFAVGRALAYILDGTTGLLALPFGRYGTSFNMRLCEETARWQIKNRKTQKQKENVK